MIIDTSAVVAVVTAEPDGADIRRAMRLAPSRFMSAATYLEAGIVIDSRRDPVLSYRYDEFITEARIRIVPLSEQQTRIARQAYRDYGKGSGHPARLNFGDCFAYALAKDLDEPLLFKGDDFGHTDVRAAPVG